MLDVSVVVKFLQISTALIILEDNGYEFITSSFTLQLWIVLLWRMWKMYKDVKAGSLQSSWQ